MPLATTASPVPVLGALITRVPTPTLVRSPPPVMPPVGRPLMVLVARVSVVPASTPIDAALCRIMAPDHVLLPPIRFSRAPAPPAPPAPLPLRMIDLLMLSPLPSTWTPAPLATTVAAPAVALPRAVLFWSLSTPALTNVCPTYVL